MAEAVLGGAMRADGSASEPGEEDYVTVVYNDEVKRHCNLKAQKRLTTWLSFFVLSGSLRV